MRRAAAAAAALVLALTAPALAASHSSTKSTKSTSSTTTTSGVVHLPGGAKAQYAAPQSRHTNGLVIVFHGHGHNGDQYAALLKQTAQRYNVVAAAMITTQLAQGKPSYRGPFQSIDEEARSAARIISWARATYGTGNRTYLFATSMGGAALAYFVDAGTRAPAGDADATLVQSSRPWPVRGIVLAEGVTNLAETWAEASAVDHTSAAEIEAETGGTPLTATAAYRSRSVALLSPMQWKTTGAPVAAIISGVDDGLVPYNQTVEARAVLTAAGLHLRTSDIVFDNACGKDVTTLTGYVDGKLEDQLCLAGHADETDPSTAMMSSAFAALGQLIGGATAASVSLVNLTHP